MGKAVTRWQRVEGGSSRLVKETLVSLQHEQAFRLLLKTSVERNNNEFTLFLGGFAYRQSLHVLFESKYRNLCWSTQRCADDTCFEPNAQYLSHTHLLVALIGAAGYPSVRGWL